MLLVVVVVELEIMLHKEAMVVQEEEGMEGVARGARVAQRLVVEAVEVEDIIQGPYPEWRVMVLME